MPCNCLLAATLLACGPGVSAWFSSKESELPSPMLTRLCQDQMCNDENFPLIDYDEDTGKCHCSAHPCWNDDGKVHRCNTARNPHLVFSYTKQGKLECGCRAEPHYMSKFIAQVKCPGQHCEGAETPMLDYDESTGKCFCRTHPCANLYGMDHSCSDTKFPILHYREEKKDGELKRVCECKQHMKAKAEF